MNLSFTDILLVVVPVTIFGAIYWGLIRYRKQALSFPVRWAYLVTLGLLAGSGVITLLVVATGSGFVKAWLFIWLILFIPVSLGSFILCWSILTLGQTPEKGGTATSKGFAIFFLSVAVMLSMFYVYSEQQCRVATNPDSSPEHLRTLYHSWYGKYDDSIPRSLASNPSTPEDILLLLIQHGDIPTRVSACHNPKIPVSLLELMASDKEMYVRRCVPFNENVTDALLKQLASDPSAEVRRTVASKYPAPADVLLKLSHDESKQVLMSLAQNKSTPLEALKTLMQHESKDVRRMLSSRDDLPLEMQLTLAKDEAKAVRLQLLWKQNVPVEVLEKLTHDSEKQIQQQAEYKLRYLRQQKKQ